MVEVVYCRLLNWHSSCTCNYRSNARSFPMAKVVGTHLPLIYPIVICVCWDI